MPSTDEKKPELIGYYPTNCEYCKTANEQCCCKVFRCECPCKGIFIGQLSQRKDCTCDPVPATRNVATPCLCDRDLTLVVDSITCPQHKIIVMRPT